MKKIIIALALIGTIGFSQTIEPPFTQTQVDSVIGDDLNQYGAGGYLVTPATNNIPQDTWTSFTNNTFVNPFVSGFEFVTNSTVRYVNGPRWFKLDGNVGVQSGIPQTCTIEVGVETNGVYVVGSTSGPRQFAADGATGNLSFSIPIFLSSNDTVGLVIKCSLAQPDIVINTWQSNASRY